MALRSMTGFGRAVTTLAGIPFVVEIRTVNHRFLDVKTRLSKTIGVLDGDVRAAVAARLARGRVEVSVSMGVEDAEAARVVIVDWDLAAEVHGAHMALAERFHTPAILFSRHRRTHSGPDPEELRVKRRNHCSRAVKISRGRTCEVRLQPESSPLARH